MAYGNTVTVVGNLTRAPEQRFTPAGAAVCNFAVAYNRKYERNGQQVEEVSFLDCVAWGELGENVSATLTKGQRVIVVGRLDQRAWETPQGEKRSKVEINCESVGVDLRFAPRGDQGGGGKRAGGNPAGAPFDGGYNDSSPF